MGACNPSRVECVSDVTRSRMKFAVWVAHWVKRSGVHHLQQTPSQIIRSSQNTSTGFLTVIIVKFVQQWSNGKISQYFIGSLFKRILSLERFSCSLLDVRTRHRSDKNRVIFDIVSIIVRSAALLDFMNGGFVHISFGWRMGGSIRLEKIY